MIRDITVRAKLCQCDLCKYSWISYCHVPPETCRNRKCRSREWNGKKQVSHAREIKLPATRKQGRPKSITLIDVREDEE